MVICPQMPSMLKTSFNLSVREAFPSWIPAGANSVGASRDGRQPEDCLPVHLLQFLAAWNKLKCYFVVLLGGHGENTMCGLPETYPTVLVSGNRARSKHIPNHQQLKRQNHPPTYVSQLVHLDAYASSSSRVSVMPEVVMLDRPKVIQ